VTSGKTTSRRGDRKRDWELVAYRTSLDVFEGDPGRRVVSGVVECDDVLVVAEVPEHLRLVKEVGLEDPLGVLLNSGVENLQRDCLASIDVLGPPTNPATGVGRAVAAMVRSGTISTVTSRSRMGSRTGRRTNRTTASIGEERHLERPTSAT